MPTIFKPIIKTKKIEIMKAEQLINENLQFVNCTPHSIVLNNGMVFEPSGSVARVSSCLTESQQFSGFFRQEFGDIDGLPDPIADTMFIVSAMVFGATDRIDVVAPSTGGKDTIRNEQGHIVSVSGFIIH